MKNNKSEKRITICIPEELFKDFQKICDENYKSMSEMIRGFVQSYITTYQTQSSIRYDIKKEWYTNRSPEDKLIYKIENLPTKPNGLSSGTIWVDDNGTLKIVR